MNTVSTFVSRHAPRIGLLLALAVLAWCALVLLGSVAFMLVGGGQPPVLDPHLAPFRWAPVGADLA